MEIITKDDTSTTTTTAAVMRSQTQPVQTGFAPRRNYATAGSGQLNDCLTTAGESNVIVITPTTTKATLTNNDLTTSHSGDGHNMPGLEQKHKSKRERLADLCATTARLQIGESLKMTDGNGMAMKTPVSILQELLSRRGITPTYELVQIEGAVHEPTFRYRVSYNDRDGPFTAMGAGRSKKEAKHSAARALIDKVLGVQLPELPNSGLSATDGTGFGVTGSVSGLTMPTDVANAIGSGDGTDKIVGNPIGWLQEMCMSRRWPPPCYETETEVGLPHERLFTIACTILNFREVGKGKSKKIAKRSAAHKMWTRLQETPLENNHIIDSLRPEIESDTRNFTEYYGDLKDMNVPTLTNQHSSKVSQFHKTLKNANGVHLLKLQNTCLSVPKLDYVKILSDIAQENQFEVTYVDIEEKTYNNQCQCLVQLSTLPVGVCHGSGETAGEAQKQAAQNALEYLKIMTKK